MDRWNTGFLLGWPIFRGELLASGRVVASFLYLSRKEQESGWHAILAVVRWVFSVRLQPFMFESPENNWQQKPWNIHHAVQKEDELEPHCGLFLCGASHLWLRNHLGAMSMMRPVLDPLTLGGIADFIKSGRCKSIFFLTGAGVSTGAGIPDFRSPGGMYDSLRPELLTATEPQRRLMRQDPVHVVTKEMFFQNQFPYMEVRRPFILGVQSQKWKATLSHWFMKFLDEEGLLKRVFTQNIDGLDYQTGIRRELVTNVHGSIANVSCEGCGRRMSFDAFCDKVRSQIKERGALENHDSTAGRKFWWNKLGGHGNKVRGVWYS